MISRRMWRYVEILYDKFTLPHYIVGWDGGCKSLQRRTGRKELNYFVLYEVNSNVHFVIMIYYYLTIGLSSTDENINETRNDNKPVLVILALLMMGVALLSNMCIYTLALNECKFINAVNVMFKFLPCLEGKSLNFKVLKLLILFCSYLKF
jgi:hypothetical protein